MTIDSDRRTQTLSGSRDPQLVRMTSAEILGDHHHAINNETKSESFSGYLIDPTQYVELNDGYAVGLFPSLQLKHKRNAAKRKRRDTTLPVHNLSSSTTSMLSDVLLVANPAKRVGRPKKPVSLIIVPVRPVGRPRLHPKKVIDPNRIKRGTHAKF